MSNDNGNNQNITDSVISQFLGYCRFHLTHIPWRANLSGLAVGLAVGWTSPSIPQLRNEDLIENPIGRLITKTEESWINALLPLGALIAPFVAGPLTNVVGRKWTLMSCAVFFGLSFLILGIGSSVAVVYVARFFQGIGTGFGNTVLPIYVGEISSVAYRGALGSLMQLFITVGILLAYVVGPYVSYNAFQWICFANPVIFAVGFFFMPESPNYFLLKGRKDKAEEALQYLRGNPQNGVSAELANIQLDIDNSQKNQGSLKELFWNRGNLWALIICSGLLFTQQACGIDVVLFNSQSIFEKAGSEIPSEVETIIIGAVQVIVSGGTVFVVERMGRKLLLLISEMGMALSIGVLGLYFYLDHMEFSSTDNLHWLPVTSLIVFIITFNVGIGPVPWAIIGELFPDNVKSLGAMIATSVCWTTSFVLMLSFEAINESLGIYWSFWIFGIFSALAFVFTFFVMFETKGLTFREIQNRLNGVKE